MSERNELLDDIEEESCAVPAGLIASVLLLELALVGSAVLFWI